MPKTVHLPSDHLTAEQLKKQSGNLISFSMKKPCTFETLKSVSPDIQKEYLQNLMDKYHAGTASIAAMLGIKEDAAREYIRSLGIGSMRGIKMNPGQREAWVQFIGEEPVVVPEPEPTHEPEPPMMPVRIEGKDLEMCHDCIHKDVDNYPGGWCDDCNDGSGYDNGKSCHTCKHKGLPIDCEQCTDCNGERWEAEDKAEESSCDAEENVREVEEILCELKADEPESGEPDEPDAEQVAFPELEPTPHYVPAKGKTMPVDFKLTFNSDESPVDITAIAKILRTAIGNNPKGVLKIKWYAHRNFSGHEYF